MRWLRRRKTDSVRQQVVNLADRKDLIGGNINFFDDSHKTEPYLYSGRILAIKIDNEKIVFWLEWCARTRVNNSGLRIGQPWRFYPFVSCYFGLAPLRDHGYISKVFVDADNIVYLDVDGSKDFSLLTITPNNRERLSREEVVGHND